MKRELFTSLPPEILLLIMKFIGMIKMMIWIFLGIIGICLIFNAYAGAFRRIMMIILMSFGGIIS